MTPLPPPIVLHAVCDILHLGVRRGETVVVFGSREWPVSVSRPLPPDYPAIRGCIEDGTLSPATASDAIEARRAIPFTSEV